MFLKIPTEPNSEFNISINNDWKLQIEILTDINSEVPGYYFEVLNNEQLNKLYKIVKTLKGE